MKPVDKDENPGLAKLPTDVRNKMGYMKHGGMTKMAKGGGIESKGKTKGAMVRMKSGGRSC